MHVDWKHLKVASALTKLMLNEAKREKMTLRFAFMLDIWKKCNSINPRV